MLRFLIFASLLVITIAKDELFTPCKVSNQTCLVSEGNKLLKSVLNGYPPFNIPSLSPFILPVIESKHPDLYFKIEPVSAFGFDNAIIKEIRMDLEKQTLVVESSAPVITLKGPYVLKGEFNNMKLDGSGFTVLNGTDITYQWNASYVLEKKSKEEPDIYARILESKAGFKLKGASVLFENISKGDEAKSRSLNDNINERVMNLIKKLGPDLAKIVSDVHLTVLSLILKNKPFDQIVIE